MTKNNLMRIFSSYLLGGLALLRRFWRELVIFGLFVATIGGLVFICRDVDHDANYLIGHEEWYTSAEHGWHWTTYGFEDQLGRTILLGQMLRDDDRMIRIFGGYQDCFEQRLAIELTDDSFQVSRSHLFQGTIEKIYWSVSLQKHAYAAMAKFSDHHFNLVVGACRDPQTIAALQKSTLTLAEWSDELQMWSKPSLIYLTQARSVYTILYFYQGQELIDVFKFDEHSSWAWNRAWLGLLMRNENFAAEVAKAEKQDTFYGPSFNEDALVKKYFGGAKMEELRRLRSIGDFRHYEQIISW